MTEESKSGVGDGSRGGALVFTVFSLKALDRVDEDGQLALERGAGGRWREGRTRELRERRGRPRGRISPHAGDSRGVLVGSSSRGRRATRPPALFPCLVIFGS